jgi:hypothetical protein
MKVSNESEKPGGGGAFAEFLRLQTDFQARLADETLRYLRRLQGAVGPSSPGTIVLPADELEIAASATPGRPVTLALEIENLQRAHCVVTPQITPFLAANGTVWIPTIAEGGGSHLIPPGRAQNLPLSLAVPPELPAGIYRAALLLQGFRDGAIAVKVTVGDAAQRPRAAKKRKRKTS